MLVVFPFRTDAKESLSRLARLSLETPPGGEVSRASSQKPLFHPKGISWGASWEGVEGVEAWRVGGV